MQRLKIWYGSASFSKNHLGSVLFAAMLAISIALISGMPASVEAASDCHTSTKLQLANPAPVVGQPYTLQARMDRHCFSFGPGGPTPGHVHFYVNGAYIGKAREDRYKNVFPLGYTFKQAGTYNLVVLYEGGYDAYQGHQLTPSTSSSVLTVYPR